MVLQVHDDPLCGVLLTLPLGISLRSECREVPLEARLEYQAYGRVTLASGSRLPRRIRFGWGISHDNTTCSGNYREHSRSVDYVARDNAHFNVTGTFYRRHDFLPVIKADDDVGDRAFIRM